MHDANYHIKQFLFIDESHVNDRTINREFGYALRGQRYLNNYLAEELGIR